MALFARAEPGARGVDIGPTYDPDTPAISVVVASFSGEEPLVACLNSLQSQGVPLEVIVATNAGELVSRLERRFVAVRFVRAPADATVFRLRTLGVSQARGRIIVLTEDHCTASPVWIAALCAANAAGHPVVGGPVENGLNRRIYDWALFYCEYVAFMPPIASGPASILSGVNVAYCREPLLSCHRVWQETFYENEVHDALRAAGYQLYREEKALVSSHLKMSLTEAMAHLFGGGRHFGRYRQSDSRPMARMIRALVSPAVPIVLFARIVKNVAARRPARLGTMVLGLPYIILLLIAWSAGEVLGYLTSGSGT